MRKPIGRRDLALFIGLAAVLVALPTGTPDAVGAPRPNIVLVLADDLGYGDLGCYGHPRLETPHLDAFASHGLRLTSCYSAAPNCSPARTGLMTGRTPFRVGVYNWIPMYSPMHVRRSEITVATLLRDAGYDTAHVGKWHLNGDFNLPTQPQPSDHGFNHWFSTQNNALPNHRNPFNFVRNGTGVGPLNGYAAELVVEEAAEWLEHGRDPVRPFFLFVCFHEPHEPIASAPEFRQRYPSDDPSLSAHHGNITQLDHAFGRLLETLERQALRDNCLIVFTSDNGPAITAIHPHGSAGPLRDRKGYLRDGGIRVPGIVQWPGVVAPGMESDVPVSGVDMLPTLCNVAGVAPPQDRTLDGTSLLPLLRGRPLRRTQPLYWQFHRSRGPVKVALRDGRWKLCARLTGPEISRGADIEPQEMAAMKAAELTDFELYDLATDIGETRDLAADRPEKLAELKQAMQSIFHDVQAEGPDWPQWTWPRYESQRIQWPDWWHNRRTR